MKKAKKLVNLMLMSVMTAGFFTFTSCTDDVEELTNDYNTIQEEEEIESRAGAANYNINNYTITCYDEVNEPLTADNWRESGGIFLYVGSNNCDTGIRDTRGGTGYILVNLPWCPDGSNSNMPTGFCDDITPENGWDMVMNYCGNRAFLNGNYFVLYNKYTGTLRVFYYVNGSYQAGNDHLWQIAMTDNLAKRSLFGYSLPEDRNIVDKTALGQSDLNDMLQFASPWVDSKDMSTTGSIALKEGWWCFDVDLSLYRPNNPLTAEDMIGFQMKSWNESNTSFYSTMLAGIDGSMKGSFEANTTGTVKSANSAQGILGKIAPFTALASPLKKTMEAWSKGNYLDLISNGFDLAKTGTNAATGKPVSGENLSMKTQGTYQGTIQMQMNGAAETEGLLTSSANISGINAPTLMFTKAFNFTPGSSVGQGIWNLKHSPVVLVTSFVQDDGAILSGILEKNLHENISYFFDPSSIEVDLNPCVFPADQIESIKVDAICGRRTDAVKGGLYDAFAKAAGYSRNVPGTFSRCIMIDKDCKNFNVQNDFLYYSDDKMGLNYIQWNDNAFGRGNSQYMLEPYQQYNYNSKSDRILAQLEVSVTLVVKMKNMDKPLIYNRIYLPEINCIGVWDGGHDIKSESYFKTTNFEKQLNEINAKIESHKNFLPQQKETALYKYQKMRIKKLCEFWVERANSGEDPFQKLAKGL